MKTMINAATAEDEKRVAAAIEKLPPEYVRDVRIFAETLLNIFESRCKKGGCAS